MAGRRLGCGVALAVVIPLVMLSSCPFAPSDNHFVLESIKAESFGLMARYPTKKYTDIPRDKLPPTIASLKPELVTVHTWGVAIMTKADMDGGWGYDIPHRHKEDLPMLPGCYSEASPGVFWHGPC